MKIADILRLSLLCLSVGKSSLVFGASHEDDKLMLIPDRFQIVERFHQPQFSIQKLNDGYRVKVSYAADTSDLSQYLFQIYGEQIRSKEIYEVELLPVKIHHFSSIFEQKNIVKNWRASFQVNEIHLEYLFTQDLTQEQIQNIFTFGFALASVDAEIQCSGQISSRLCDQVIKDIPLFNQYAFAARSTESELVSDYSTLSRYVSMIRLGKSYLNLTTATEVDAYLKSDFFLDDQCKKDLSSGSAPICRLIMKYSQHQSILEAIGILRVRLFEDKPLDAGVNFYILDSTQFAVTNLGPVPDAQCSVYDAFCPMTQN